MKQLLLLFSAIIAFVAFGTARVNAQNNPIVALQHEGTTTYFTGLTCLEDAIEKAVDNDILYLSEGEFGITVSSNNNVPIRHTIGLVGSGFNTNIRSNIQYYVPDGQNQTFEVPALRNLSIDRSVQFSTAGLFKNVQIEKCHIGDINLEEVEDAKITSSYFGFFYPSSCKADVYNSKIEKYRSYSFTDRLINCHVKLDSDNYTRRPGYAYATIFEGRFFSEQGLLENCLVNEYDATDNVKNCYTYSGETIFNQDLEVDMDLKALGYVDTDGDEIGIYGGKSDHYSEVPSVPVIDTKNTTVEYDSENSRLTIKATIIMD